MESFLYNWNYRVVYNEYDKRGWWIGKIIFEIMMKRK